MASRLYVAASIGVVLWGCAPASMQAADVLVADRLTNSVYRYSETGDFLGVVLRDNVNINRPVGLALSPDLKKLYISSSQNSRLISYDYNYAAGTASNPTILAQGRADGLAFPNAILFEPDGSKLYVSNLDDTPNNPPQPTGIAQFYPDGTSAGPNIDTPFGGGSMLQFSGLAFAPDGELLVGGFLDYPTGSKGAVGKSNEAITTLSTLINPDASLAGASGLLVHGDHLYVSGMFASNIQRFNVHTGALDSSFSTIGGLAFPQGLVASPDGNGFLVGILGYINGTGHIAHYDFSGNKIGDGIFAMNGGGGFREATVFIVEPPMPGDFDGNRIVDAADLAVWQENYGLGLGSATIEVGDADNDGDVDGRDFLIWQRHITLPSSISAVSVPEPNSVILLLVATQAALAFGIFRWRRAVATA